MTLLDQQSSSENRKVTKSFLDTLNKISILGIIFMGALTLAASIMYTLVLLFY